MEDSIFKLEGHATYAVYAGSFAPLNLIDFSFLNLKFAKIDSAELLEFSEKTYHKSLPSRNQSYLEGFQKELHTNVLYVLFPISLEKEINTDTYIEIQNLFLIMFPSDFRLHAEVHCQLFDKKYLFPNGNTTWPFSGEKENYLSFDESNVVEINEFIRLYFERKDSIKYLRVTIPSYINAIFQDHLHMAFVSLCISLESITDGRSELIYRIRRNCAIINGENRDRSKVVYQNVNKFYALRSTIVHGDEFDWNKVEEYYPKLRALVSRTIIELITLNIKSIDELNTKLTETGFGDRHLLNPNYKQFKLDIISVVEIIKTVN